MEKNIPYETIQQLYMAFSIFYTQLKYQEQEIMPSIEEVNKVTENFLEFICSITGVDVEKTEENNLIN